MLLIFKILTMSVLCLLLVSSCTDNSAQKTRYNMEKMAYLAGRLADQLNIRPELTTIEDSERLKKAHQDIVDYFYDHKNEPTLATDSVSMAQMARMALASQLFIASYYQQNQKIDSLMMVFRSIGNDIPAGRDDYCASRLGLANAYRTLQQFDSALTIYDSILTDYYPPLDYYGQVNRSIMAIPINKIRISQDLDNSRQISSNTEQALKYYNKIKSDFPDNHGLARSADINTSRVYAHTDQWDKTIDRLYMITDSTGAIDVAAQTIIGNIYNGPKNNLDSALIIYQSILEREPDSAIIGQTLLDIGRLYCARENYTEGRSKLAELKKKFQNKQWLMAQAQFLIAQSFQAQNNGDRALLEFQWLMDNYPFAEESFRAASIIPEYFMIDGDIRLAEIWYNKALEFYQNAIDKKAQQMTILSAYSHMSNIYRKIEQPRLSLEALDKLYSHAPGSKLAAKALYISATIAFHDLKDSTLAQGYLDRLNKEFGTTDSTVIYKKEKPTFIMKSLE